MTRRTSSTVSVARLGWLPNGWDVLALLLVLGVLALFAEGARGMAAPIASLAVAPVDLDPRHLPYYALRSTLRMVFALVPMLSPRMAALLWGFDEPTGSYRFAMGYGPR